MLDRNIESLARLNLKITFNLCASKTRSNIKRLADEPKSYALAVDGNYFNFQEGFNEIGNWTSSFFTGMALLAWRETWLTRLRRTLDQPLRRNRPCVFRRQAWASRNSPTKILIGSSTPNSACSSTGVCIPDRVTGNGSWKTREWPRRNIVNMHTLKAVKPTLTPPTITRKRGPSSPRTQA